MRREHSHAEFVRPAGLLELGACGEQRVDRFGRLQMILLCAVLWPKDLRSERERVMDIFTVVVGCWLGREQYVLHTHTHTHIQEIEKYLWSECDQCKTELQTWAVPCIWVFISLSATPTPYTRRGRTIAVFIDKKNTMFQIANGIYKCRLLCWWDNCSDLEAWIFIAT